jgi:regulatory protein
LRQLAAAPKSRAQLAAALAKYEVPTDVAEAVLDRFTTVGLVDDVALAEMLVRTRHAERGLTGPALAAELRRRGINDEVANQAMNQINRDDEAERALALVRRKLAACAGLRCDVRDRRIYAHLARKGYSPATVRRALEQALVEEAGSDGRGPFKGS